MITEFKIQPSDLALACYNSKHFRCHMLAFPAHDDHRSRRGAGSAIHIRNSQPLGTGLPGQLKVSHLRRLEELYSHYRMSVLARIYGVSPAQSLVEFHPNSSRMPKRLIVNSTSMRRPESTICCGCRPYQYARPRVMATGKAGSTCADGMQYYSSREPFALAR
jgi:hypothetical protein